MSRPWTPILVFDHHAPCRVRIGQHWQGTDVTEEYEVKPGEALHATNPRWIEIRQGKTWARLWSAIANERPEATGFITESAGRMSVVWRPDLDWLWGRPQHEQPAAKQPTPHPPQPADCIAATEHP